MTDLLPTFNAGFNALSATLLFFGWRAIRRGDKELHKRLMILALCSSALFLVGYLTRLGLAGPTKYQGAGRPIYLAILMSHTLLAASLVVLVPWTVVRAGKGRFEAHKKIARITLPIWFYVSVTGVVIYLFLYVA